MRFRHPAGTALGTGLAAALVVIVGLLGRIGDIREEFVKSRQRATLPHEGAFVPPVRAPTLTGDSITLGEPRGADRQLLLVFTTTCPFCKATLPVWDSLADSIRRADPSVQIVGVSLDSAGLAQTYATDHQLSYPIVTLTAARWRFLYRAGAVPQTVVVEAGGLVRYATVGKLTAGVVLDSVYRAVFARAESTGAAVAQR